MIDKIWLSPPFLFGKEQELVSDVFKSNWITTTGDAITTFENDLESFIGNEKSVVCLNSGTSAIHTALVLAGVGYDDTVLCPSLTFVASVNPVLYQGAKPVFIDSEPSTFGMCPDLLEEAINDQIKKNKIPKAIIAVHVNGMPCKIDRIKEIAQQHQITLIEDAAGALGSYYKGKPCGSFGDYGVYSFNGNKIITSSSGGALILNSKEEKQKAIYLVTQAKMSKPYYAHKEIGYNYRMSNVLAAIGIGQLANLNEILFRLQKNTSFYTELFEVYKNVQLINPNNSDITYNNWLNSIVFNDVSKINPSILQEKLNKLNIEARRIWSPLHTNELFFGSENYTNGVSESIFLKGLSLPSGANLTVHQKEYIKKSLFKIL